jgi:hypothetical protein
MIFQHFKLAFFPKEITVHSGIVWRDEICGDRHKICERVEVSISNINFLDDQN